MTQDTWWMILHNQIRLDDSLVPHHQLVLMEIYTKCLVVTPTFTIVLFLQLFLFLEA